MSEFSNITKIKCIEVQPEEEQKNSCSPCNPDLNPNGMDWHETVEPFYDSGKERYYIKQAYDLQNNFLESLSSTIEMVITSQSSMSIAAKQRILNFFNFDFTNEEIDNIKCTLQDYKVSDMSLKPVEFLFYIDAKQLPNNKKDSKDISKESYEAISFNSIAFFGMLELLEKKMKIYSKFQSLLFYSDRMKIIKDENTPFYVSLINNRLTEFKKELLALLDKNNFDFKKIDQIVFYVDKVNSVTKIAHVTVDNSIIKSYEHDLSIGLPEFLNLNILNDSDLISYILNIENMVKPNLDKSWMDLIIDNGKNLSLKPVSLDTTSCFSCFTDYDPMLDSILDIDMSFMDRLEFSFHNKNSLALADVIKRPDILLSQANSAIPQSFEDLLSEDFKKVKQDTASMESKNPDNVIDNIQEILSDFSFKEGSFDKMYQFLGPASFSSLLDVLLSNFQKMMNPEEMYQLIINTFLDSIEFEGFSLLLEKLPNKAKFEFLKIIKEKLNIIMDMDDFLIDYTEVLKEQKLKNIIFEFKKIFGVLPKIELPDIGCLDIDTYEINNFLKIIDKLPQVAQLEFLSDLELDIGDLKIMELGSLQIDNFNMNLLSVAPELDFNKFLKNQQSIILEFPDLKVNFENIINFQEFGLFYENLSPDIKLKFLNNFKVNFPSIRKFNPIQLQKIGDLKLSLPETFKNINFDQVNKSFDGLDIKFPELNLESFKYDTLEGFSFPEINNIGDIFGDLPEFKKIADIVDMISIPNINLTSSLDLLKGLGVPIPLFNEKFLKIPDIPDFPDIKFSIVKFIQENLVVVIKLAIQKVLALIINKIVGFIKNFSLDGLNNNFPIDSDGEVNLSNGLESFVSSYLCKTDPEDLSLGLEEVKDEEDATQSLLKTLTPKLKVSDDSYKSLAKTIGSSASIADIINAVVEDDSKVNDGFLNDLAEVIRNKNPEFSEYFEDDKAAKVLFRRTRDFMSPEIIQNLKDYKDSFSSPEEVEESYCIPKQKQAQWIEDKEDALKQRGYKASTAKKIVKDELKKVKKNTSDVLELLTKDFDDRLFDSIDDILNNSDPECDSLYSSPEAKETIMEQDKKNKNIQNMGLEKISLAFVEDLLDDGFFSFIHQKGMLSRILSDKHKRSMSVVNFLKSNFFTALLMKAGIIPAPEPPTSIGKLVTENLSSLDYNSTENTLEILAAPSATVRYEDNNLNYFIKIEDEVPIDSDTTIPKEVDISYPNLSSQTRTEFINTLVEEYDNFSQDDEKVFTELHDVLDLSAGIAYGSPPEVTSATLQELQGNYEETGDLNSTIEGFEHIKILQPETYGSFFGKPKLYVSEKELPDGFLKRSKEFYDVKTSEKLDRTILNLSSIGEFNDSYKDKLDKSKYLNVSPENLSDTPFDKVHISDKLAQAQSMVKTYLRVYLSEYIILANNVFRVSGFKLDKKIFSNYILHKIKNEMKTIKVPSKSIYSEYVVYLLMLMSNAEMHSKDANNPMSDIIKSLDENYSPLTKKQIRNIKSTSIKKEEKIYENYIRGYYGIAYKDTANEMFEQPGSMNIDSSNMTSSEIKFTNKLGYAMKNINTLEDALKLTIMQEIEIYDKKYPPVKDINREFLKILTGESILFTPLISSSSPWRTNSYYVIKEKNGEEKEISKARLILRLQLIPTGERSKYISDFFGDAEIDDDSYIGTIGIKYGVRLYYNETVVNNFTEDVKDTTIIELLDSLNEDVHPLHECFVDNFFETIESKIIFDLAFQVKRLPTIIAIYYMENLIPSINGHGEESTAFSLPEVGEETPLFKIDGLSYRIPNLISTKKEIKEAFVANYIREFYDPPLPTEKSFFDFKAKEIISKSIDFKNLSTELSFFERLKITDNVELDENGNPVINKFLENFK